MNKKEDLDFNNLTESQLSSIKESALSKFMSGHNSYYRSDVMTVDCFVSGFISFLNLHGYKIIKKEDQDGK